MANVLRLIWSASEQDCDNNLVKLVEVTGEPDRCERAMAECLSALDTFNIPHEVLDGDKEAGQLSEGTDRYRVWAIQADYPHLEVDFEALLSAEDAGKLREHLKAYQDEGVLEEYGWTVELSQKPVIIAEALRTLRGCLGDSKRKKEPLVIVQGGVAQNYEQGCGFDLLDYDNLVNDGGYPSEAWDALSEQAKAYVRENDPEIAARFEHSK